MPDRRFDGKRVSGAWDVVLTEARRQGVRFTLTSGRRTLAEQAALYSAYRNGSGVLAAFPSPVAPHIRVGRADHAIDVNALDGGEQRLERWLRKQGTRPTNPVRGEAWHLELPRRELIRLARRIKRRNRRRRR